MKNQLIKILSNFIDPQLVKNLIESYEKVRKNHIKDNPEGVLNLAGKFVENLFIVLEFINSGIKLEEVKNMRKIKVSLENNTTLPEPIRILIPRIASSLIWDTRSKMGAAHVKAINPDFMDSELVISACDWIMAELLRNYHARNSDEVKKIINALIKKDTPLLQKFGEELLVTKKLGCGLEVLLVIYDSEPEGLSREQIGKAIRGYSPAAITLCINKLEEKRNIIKLKSKKIRITNLGEKYLFEKIE